MTILVPLRSIHQLILTKFGYRSIQEKLHFGFNLILMFMAGYVVVSVIGLLLVLKSITALIDEQEPAVFASIKLDKHIKDASGSLGLYLLSNEQIYRLKYEAELDSVESILLELKNLEPIQEDETSLRLINSIEQDIARFKSFQDTFYKLIGSLQNNFPSIQYAANYMNPLSSDILGNLNNIIMTELDEPATAARKKLLMTVSDLRYNWTNVMKSVRSILTYRSEVSEKNIRIYLDRTEHIIQKIKTLSSDEEQGFVFEQADMFALVLSSHDEYVVHLEKFLKSHKSEQWRQDSYLMRTEVGPLLRGIDLKLQQLVNSTQHKINAANNFLIAEVIVIIFIALVLLATAYWVAKRVSGQIINSIVVPLNLAVAATGRIAVGDLTVTIEQSSEDEIGQLIRSLNVMSVNLATLVSNVKLSGIQVSSSSTEISATAKQQEATVTEQAATANQISVTAKEISATVQELVQTMDEVTGVTEKTANAATNSQSALGTMEQTMHNMLDATAGIGSKLSVLSEKAANINSVVTTITKVADQTNLLSLNAAIEAEKAGEYGVGFSVVATEIRRLADQTAVATWDIEQMVKEMQSAVAAGVMGMDKFTEEVRLGVDDVRQVGAQLANIIEQVQLLLPSFEEVYLGMQNQASGARKITESIGQLSEGTNLSAQSLRQSNNSISILYNAARSLQDGVSKFNLKKVN